MLRRFKPYRRLAGGPKERINLLRGLINHLVKYERLETTYGLAHETQKYAERLINVAKKGDHDPAAMKLADYWLYEKQLVHKLFKVLVPRFENSTGLYTRLLKVPGYNEKGIPTAFLEYKGNPYPPLRPEKRKNPDWIINQLIRGAMLDLKNSGKLKGDSSIPPSTNTRSSDRVSAVGDGTAV
ncbi:39S ribosomal protein L17, mitochondrial-like isoform X2 [Anneissia japonica]|uniref:39S ribosomal protein L17, mitochondrial-like isoform X1 n=1 Tax=Anneissia japonica TaxID=1529436 RepID=UPI001425AE63|nr:39S ribosomal protein L17, mitochondrial-like isoform X1 [Anneissia japonica]XP_033106167.1 39S ribosomal protein L17, mitochondrial-like isoform X2 [Anneissia japonica]